MLRKMPYIQQYRREQLDPLLEKLGAELWWEEKPGILNYIITKACLAYLHKANSYQLYNEVIGVLECVKQELYRRMIAPYEDKKIEENGDVY